MTQIKAPVRASEKVRKYVLDEFADTGGSARLPTMRHLASELNVSLATVQAVYRQLKNEGRIATRAGDGSFLIRASSRGADAEVKIALNYLPSREEMDVSDMGKIYGGMLHASIHLDRRVSFSPLRDLSAPSKELLRSVENGEADGVIIFPTGSEKELARCCKENGIPYVCLQPPFPEANSNFVSAEHFSPGYTIGRAFAAGARKRIAFFMAGKPTQSTSAWELLSGMTCGVIEETGEANIELYHHKSPAPQTPQEFEEHIRDWLHQRRKNLPDGIFCHRMAFATSVIKTMTALGKAAPRDFALVTHDDVFAPAQKQAQITHTGAPLVDIGRSLVDMLMKRIDNGNQDYPPVRIPSLFGGGQTTSKAENEVLGF